MHESDGDFMCKISGMWMQSKLPAIIATAIQLSYLKLDSYKLVVSN